MPRLRSIIIAAALLACGTAAGACSSEAKGDSKCAKVCDCVVAKLGSSAESSCYSQCSETSSVQECRARLDANGASSCSMTCNTFTASGSSSASRTLCGPNSTGCGCSYDSGATNDATCGVSDTPGGVCCASSGWPDKQHSCSCKKPTATDPAPACSGSFKSVTSCSG